MLSAGYNMKSPSGFIGVDCMSGLAVVYIQKGSPDVFQGWTLRKKKGVQKMKMRKVTALLLSVVMMTAVAACASGDAEPQAKEESGVQETQGEEETPQYKVPEFEHNYELQDDSYESTDTEGGYRHYICADCGDEYSYETDPLVYETNPKTGEPVDQDGAYNPLLPSWENIPDTEPKVFWSKEDKEWRVYLYGSHDDTGKGYCGMNYVLWSAPVYDLSDWRNEGVILDISEGATSGATVGLFAPDCAYDVTTDRYYMMANEFNAYAVMRVAESPTGPWTEDEALWTISSKGCYDPAIYIEDGTIYVAGSCMKPFYSEYEDLYAKIEADGYSSGMSHIGVLFQLKDDPTDGDGIEAVSWMKNDERDYFPIYEGPSLPGYIDELGVYVYLYVSHDYDSDGTWYNSSIGYAWTDDLMNGTWHYGENGVDEVYAETEELISGNHGNIISDTSGRYVRNAETGEMEFTEFPTYVHGNNHGGIAKVNGKWYFFGHRHTNASTYSRQSIAGEIKLYKDGDTPVIEPMEFTSSGIAGSMDAYTVWDANRTTYLLEAVDHQAPSAERDNVHTDCIENTPYVVANRDEQATHASYIADLKSGNVVGYKYIDFGENEENVNLNILVSREDGFVNGTADIYLDAPSEDQGGTKIGSIDISEASVSGASSVEESTDKTTWSWLSSDMDAAVGGTHGVYLVFNSENDGVICKLDQLLFEK